MAKKIITEEQIRKANKAGYSTQQIAGELNKYEKTT
jgi:IS30 family transposase